MRVALGCGRLGRKDRGVVRGCCCRERGTGGTGCPDDCPPAELEEAGPVRRAGHHRDYIVRRAIADWPARPMGGMA